MREVQSSQEDVQFVAYELWLWYPQIVGNQGILHQRV